MNSVTPHFFFDISDITNSSTLSGKSLRKKSMLENLKLMMSSGVRLLLISEITNIPVLDETNHRSVFSDSHTGNKQNVEEIKSLNLPDNGKNAIELIIAAERA